MELLLSHLFIGYPLIGPVLIDPAHVNVAFSDLPWMVTARSTAEGTWSAMFVNTKVTQCVGTSILAGTC